MHILCWGKSPCYLYQKVKLKHNPQRQKSVEKTMHFGLMITLPVTSVLLFVKGLQGLFHVLSHLTDPAQREGGSLIYGWSIIIGGLYKTIKACVSSPERPEELRCSHSAVGP